VLVVADIYVVLAWAVFAVFILWVLTYVLAYLVIGMGAALDVRDWFRRRRAHHNEGAVVTVAPSTAAQPTYVRRTIPERVRHEVWRRDQGRCVDCGNRERLEFDHIIPVSRGGSNTARNLELRCESCNRRKAASI
jgi:5-methylcytosine-specific restriction endonuclease McrA